MENRMGHNEGLNERKGRKGQSFIIRKGELECGGFKLAGQGKALEIRRDPLRSTEKQKFGLGGN